MRADPCTSGTTPVRQELGIHTAERNRVCPRGLQRVQYSGPRKRSRFWTYAQVIGCFPEKLRDVRANCAALKVRWVSWEGIGFESPPLNTPSYSRSAQ